MIRRRIWVLVITVTCVSIRELVKAVRLNSRGKCQRQRRDTAITTRRLSSAYVPLILLHVLCNTKHTKGIDEAESTSMGAYKKHCLLREMPKTNVLQSDEALQLKMCEISIHALPWLVCGGYRHHIV